MGEFNVNLFFIIPLQAIRGPCEPVTKCKHGQSHEHFQWRGPESADQDN